MKRIIALLLCVILAFSVCGCGKPNPEKIAQNYANFTQKVNAREVVAVNPRVYYTDEGEVYLIADIENKTNAKIDGVCLTFAIWDQYGNPLPLTTTQNPTNPENAMEITMSAAKVEPNSTWEAISGVKVSDNAKNVCFVTAFISDYNKDGTKVVDGSLFALYDEWKEEYVGKKMQEHHFQSFTPFKTEEYKKKPHGYS